MSQGYFDEFGQWIAQDGGPLPAQTGHSGQYLTTDGTSPSWGTPGGGGMTIGSPVSGGTATEVLYVDGSGNLGQSAHLKWGTTALNGGYEAVQAVNTSNTYAASIVVSLASGHSYGAGIGLYLANGNQVFLQAFDASLGCLQQFIDPSGNTLIQIGHGAITIANTQQFLFSDFNHIYTSSVGLAWASTGVIQVTNGSSGGGSIATGSSATSGRPTVTTVGAQWWDATLGKPIWWSGAHWVDATGTTV